MLNRVLTTVLTVILGTKQLKYYFKFMKMTDIDLFYIKKTLKSYIKTWVFILFTETLGTLSGLMVTPE